MGKAAIRLATSQSAVSRSIAELEVALGVRLLDRSPRGIEPTAYGRALLKRGVAVFDELAQGIKDIHFVSDPTAGELRIGASIAIATGFVSSGVAGVHNSWTRRRRLKLSELVNEPWVLPPPDAPYGAMVFEAFRANGLKVPRAVVTSTLPVRSALLATGRFLSMVPRITLQFPAKDQSLRGLPVALPTTLGPLAIITLRNRTLNPVAKLFSDCARDMAKLPSMGE